MKKKIATGIIFLVILAGSLFIQNKVLTNQKEKEQKYLLHAFEWGLYNSNYAVMEGRRLDESITFACDRFIKDSRFGFESFAESKLEDGVMYTFWEGTFINLRDRVMLYEDYETMELLKKDPDALERRKDLLLDYFGTISR